MEENKVKLECDYCGVPIGEKDHKCPNCGANCTDKIKKYAEQKQQQEAIEQEKRIEQSKAIQKQMNAPVKGILIVSVCVFVIIVGFIIFSWFNYNNKITETVSKVPKAKVVCTEDSYELYEYKSDSFPKQYNTPDGYQKIAFNIVCENKSKDEESIIYDISLTADDYAVKEASLETGPFETVVKGKESYPKIRSSIIEPGEKAKGYAGFTVPKDKKKLKLKIDLSTSDDIVIDIDNPVYEGE